LSIETAQSLVESNPLLHTLAIETTSYLFHDKAQLLLTTGKNLIHITLWNNLAVLNVIHDMLVCFPQLETLITGEIQYEIKKNMKSNVLQKSIKMQYFQRPPASDLVLFVSCFKHFHTIELTHVYVENQLLDVVMDNNFQTLEVFKMNICDRLAWGGGLRDFNIVLDNNVGLEKLLMKCNKICDLSWHFSEIIEEHFTSIFNRTYPNLLRLSLAHFAPSLENNMVAITTDILIDVLNHNKQLRVLDLWVWGAFSSVDTEELKAFIKDSKLVTKLKC